MRATDRELQLLQLVISERSGRDVAKLYAETTGEPIQYGTVYTLFEDMEQRGWVRMRETTERGRVVRMFKITGGVGVAILNGAVVESRSAGFLAGVSKT